MRKYPSAKEVAKLTKRGRYAVGHNVYLQVSEWGTRSWIFRYRVGGTARHMGVGPYDLLTLAEARERGYQERRKLLTGIDPLTEKRAVKREKLLATAHAKTFKECAAAYIAAHESGWRGSASRKQWQQSLDRYVHPKIGNLPVASVDLASVLSALEPIWTIIPESARRIRNRVQLVLDWATARGLRQGDNPARWKGLLENLLPQKKPNGVEHLAAMKYVDVPPFMARLRNEQGFAAKALKFQILTAVRPGQACGARWSEIEGDTWIIPAERTKNGREHRVPLSQEAVELVANLPRIVGSEYVFSAPRGGPMHAREALRVLHRLCPGNAVSHGFRSAFSDWAHECTAYAPHVIEQVLGHVVGTAVERAYRRTDLFEQRRRLMQQWSEYCSKPDTANGVVVPLRQELRQ
jgi:integrase